VYQTGGQSGLLRLVRPDGSDDHNLVRQPLPGVEAHPAWSPDGQNIAFDVAADSPTGPPHSSIWVVDANEVDTREIAACELPCRQLVYPVWSPDGRSIALTRYDLKPNGGWGPSAVEVVNVDSGQRQVIIQTPDGTSAYYQPDWSPDGTSLVVSVETYPDARQASVSTRTVAVLRADDSDPKPMIISDPADFAIEPD
jgi:Tol biopolymer transport system component